MNRKVGNISHISEKTSYYETKANFNPSDRVYIIKKGFREWLMDADVGNEAEAAAEKSDISIPPEYQMKDITVLLANLVGGSRI